MEFDAMYAGMFALARTRSIEEITSAAREGDIDCQFTLAMALRSGFGICKNYSEAVKWCNKAAEGGHQQARLHLGHWYYLGNCVAQNLSEAAFWYRLAAQDGNLCAAQYQLGLIYESGLGVESDQTQALKWFQQAVDNGYPGQDAILRRDEVQRKIDAESYQ